MGGTLATLTSLRLLSLDDATVLGQKPLAPTGHRYLQVTGDLAVPFKESPLFEGGHPRSQASFERAYRRNLAAYIEASQKSFKGPGTNLRVQVLSDDHLWQGLTQIGNPAAFNQAIPGISSFEAAFIGSEYIFVITESADLARLSSAAYEASQAIQQGNVNAYTAALNRLRAALRPFRKSDHYFETNVPWLLLVFDDLMGGKTILSADCDITGLPRQRLMRGNGTP